MAPPGRRIGCGCRRDEAAVDDSLVALPIAQSADSGAGGSQNTAVKVEERAREGGWQWCARTHLHLHTLACKHTISLALSVNRANKHSPHTHAPHVPQRTSTHLRSIFIFLRCRSAISASTSACATGSSGAVAQGSGPSAGACWSSCTGVDGRATGCIAVPDLCCLDVETSLSS